MADRIYNLKEVEPEIVPPQSLKEAGERLVALEKWAFGRKRSGPRLYARIEGLEARIRKMEEGGQGDAGK